MLQLEQAIERILESLPAPQLESIALTEAHCRVLAQSICSQIDLPPFDNSAMDGYAVRAEDLREAKPETPVRLRLIGRIAAGESATSVIKAGECVRVFTGSPLPSGADAVVMQEDARVDPAKPDEVAVLEAVRAWENIRLRGEDVRFGATLGQKGETLKAGRLSLLSATGMARVTVGRAPVVVLIATGSELREPGQPLAPGQIYESNRVGLGALLRAAGAKVIIYPLIPDTLEATEAALARAFSQCDFIVTAGGASVGELDLVRPAFERLGGELQFWRVAIRPGRPFAFGRQHGKFLFGLPGNPVSAMVTLLLLVWPAIRSYQGANQVELWVLPGVLAEALTNQGPRRHFMRVLRESNGIVRLAGGQESHMLSSWAAAGGLVDVPPQTTLPAGSSVAVRVWEL
jgi:molybdopterin molybdotransferase